MQLIISSPSLLTVKMTKLSIGRHPHRRHSWNKRHCRQRGVQFFNHSRQGALYVCALSAGKDDPNERSGMENCWICFLGADQIQSICLLLPLESLLSLGMTCRRMRDICFSDALWEMICRRDWGDPATDAILSSSFSSSSRFLPSPSSSDEGRYKRKNTGEWRWKRVFEQVRQANCLSCVHLTQGGGYPQSRASHSLNFIADSLVLFGGGCEGGRHLDDTWVAYIGKERNKDVNWRCASSGIPSGRFGQSCVVVGDVLVLFGGIDDSGIRKNDTWIAHVTGEEKHGVGITWKQLEVGFPSPQPRGAHAGCYAGRRKMVIHGGIDQEGHRLEDAWLLELLDNGLSGTWHELLISLSPLARSGHSLTYVGGSRLVLFGGRGIGYEVLNDAWLLDLTNVQPSWIKLPIPYNVHDVPLPRVGHSATEFLGGRVLIFGGEDSYRNRKDDFWVLDPGATQQKKGASRKLWKKLNLDGHLPNSRSFHRICADRSGCRIYVFGGMVDGIVHPAETSGLMFDGELYLAELVLRL